MAKVKHVQGNTFILGIPLAKRIIEFDGGVRSQNDESISPLLKDAPIMVIFGRNRVNKAKLVGGYVVVENKGTLPVGNYYVTVLATDANGDPLRFVDDLELGIVNTIEETDYAELDNYDGYFKMPIIGSSSQGVCLIVITEDAVQINEGAGFEGEVTEDAVKLYARFGLSETEVTEDAVKILIH